MNLQKYTVPSGSPISLKDHDPDDTGKYKNKDDALKDLQDDIDTLAKLQDVLNRFLAATIGEAPQQLVQIEAERQADQFGAQLLVRAGFDLQKARSFLERLHTYRSGVITAEFAHSHPSDQERLVALDEIIQEIQERQERASWVP